MRKAFGVECYNIESITFAENAAAAKYNVFRSLKEANWIREKIWPAMNVYRLPEFDNSDLKDKKGCFSREYVKGLA